MNNMKTRRVVYVALGIALLTLCGWISIPSAPPITLQTMAILVLSGVLGTKYTLFCIVGHIILGLIGLPVFSGFRNLVGVLFSPWGGYVIGFATMPMVVGMCVKRYGTKPLPLLISAICATCICYICSVLWFEMFVRDASFPVSALVIPFIPADICKTVASVYLIRRLSPLVADS